METPVTNTDNTTDPVLQYCDYRHLPPNLQETSKLFAALAAELVRRLPRCPQRTTALNLLVQAKDCAVRSLLPAKTVTVDELCPPAPKSLDPFQLGLNVVASDHK